MLFFKKIKEKITSKKKNDKSNVLQNLKKAESLGEIATILAENQLISIPKDNNHNTFGRRLDKLDENGELPWGWEFANRDFISVHDGKLFNLCKQCSISNSIDDEMKNLVEFINYYYSYKNECKEKGECFYKYFENMHMKCFDSQNPCFELVQPKEERLAYIKSNYQSLINKEIRLKKIEQDIIPTLGENLLNIISENPGIIQTDIYKMYDEDIKSYISEKLYFFDHKEKLIRREKYGRTYKIYKK